MPFFGSPKNVWEKQTTIIWSKKKLDIKTFYQKLFFCNFFVTNNLFGQNFFSAKQIFFAEKYVLGKNFCTVNFSATLMFQQKYFVLANRKFGPKKVVVEKYLSKIKINICISASLYTGLEMQCLPYKGFYFLELFNIKSKK